MQPWLLDSNILIRWVQPDSVDFPVVKRALNALELGIRFCYTSQNLAEFWNACTRPISRNGFGLKPLEADSRVRIIEARCQLLVDGLAVHQQWRRLLIANEISGVQVHDARLAASMLVHGVGKILTFNTRDFQRYAGIEAVHPQDVTTA